MREYRVKWENWSRKDSTFLSLLSVQRYGNRKKFNLLFWIMLMK